MSSGKIPDKRKDQEIIRNKKSRRKMLKSMAAGSGAVIAGKSIPDQWAKPIVDSVLLPVHAQTSVNPPGPSSCSVSGNIEGSFRSGGDPASGTYAIPGTYAEFNVQAGTITLTPLISVTPGITDAFNLTTVSSQPTVGSDLDQNVIPSANGVLAFDPIATSDPGIGDQANFVMTLTPVNTTLCGGQQVINITFNTGANP